MSMYIYIFVNLGELTLPSVADSLIDSVTMSFGTGLRADRLPIHDPGSGTEGRGDSERGQK